MNIVIDEWIVHFISSESDEEQKWVYKFLTKVLEKCDKFVTLKGEKLEKKIFRMAKESSNWKPQKRSLVKWFMANFNPLNTKKFYFLEDRKIMPLPLELEKKIPEDDLYLVKAAISTKESFILTTDNRLKEKMSSQQEITIYLVDEFLEDYERGV